MRIEIKEIEQTYRMNNVNWAKIENNELTINYVDDAGEIHEVSGIIESEAIINFKCI